MTEAFSSLRIESFKNLLRMHITPEGNLEVFALGLDKVAKKWERDPEWSGRHYRNSLKGKGLPQRTGKSDPYTAACIWFDFRGLCYLLFT